MKSLFTIFFLMFCSALSSFAQQRPLLTDDVDITPEGTVEFSAGVDFLQNAKFPLSGLKGDQTRLGDIRLSIGLAPNVEFMVEGTLQSFVSINSAGVSAIPLNLDGDSTNDTGDFTLSTKIKLTNETARLPALGFKLGVQLPNSNQARGIGTNQVNVFGNILLQKKFGKQRGRDPRLNLSVWELCPRRSKDLRRTTFCFTESPESFASPIKSTSSAKSTGVQTRAAATLRSARKAFRSFASARKSKPRIYVSTPPPSSD
jgi:hypothetical protein